MPLALLLQATFGVFKEGADKLDPWNQIVTMELVLLDRVRSAFLVHWFGPHLPLQGQQLRIAIANLDALRARYQAVKSATPAASGGLNLTEPLAGLAGQMLGALLSPSGILLTGLVAVRRVHGWLKDLGIALLTIVGAAVVPALVGGIAVVALPLALLGAIVLAVKNPEEATNIHALLGSLAQMLEALRRFVEQLLGPREAVRNPLVQRLLLIFDRLAALVPQSMALFALLFARVGPLLMPLAAQVPRLRALVESVIKAVVFIVEDWLQRLTALYTDMPAFAEPEETLGALSATSSGGVSLVFTLLQRTFATLDALFQQNPSPLTLIALALRSLTAVPAAILRGLMGVFGSLRAEFARIGAEMARLVRAWSDAAATAVRAAITSHPAAQALIAGREAMATVAAAWRRLTPPSPPAPPAPAAPPSSPGLLKRAGAAIYSMVVPPFPQYHAPPTASVLAAAGPTPILELNAGNVTALATLLETGLKPSFALGAGALAAIQRARRPASVFTAERLALRDAAGRTPAEQLAAARVDELPLRSALLAIVRRVLPAAASGYVRQLQSLFEALDEQVYRAKSSPATEPAPELPVLQVRESNRLQPSVHRLHIVAAGVDGATASAWADSLRQALAAQPYAAAAGGRAGGR